MHVFLTSALVGGECSSRLGRFTPGERALGTHWIGDWMGPKAGLDDVEERKFLSLTRLELRLSIVAIPAALSRLPFPSPLISIYISVSWLLLEFIFRLSIKKRSNEAC
jgi:hypothetical protein